MNFEEADISWILTCSALVFLMIPGLGYFYSGMAQSKNALSLILLCCLSVAIVSIEWFLFGYTLAFSKTGGPLIGDFKNTLLMNVLFEPSYAATSLPELAFMFYQGMFASITPALAIGAAAERGRLLPSMVFIFLWSLGVYNFVAYWTWSPNGWAAKLGSLDFAGGTPVHITSGFTALVYSIVLGKRKDHGEKEFKPHNISNVILGTALLWFGWFGFNGGSALSSNLRAILACVNTNLAASAGGLTWLLVDYFFIEKKFSALSFCSGVVAGLVAITPAAGFVDIPSSLLFGVLGAFCCSMAVRMKKLGDYDDALDVFAVHGVGGIVGCLLTGVFARKSKAGLDPTLVIEGGFFDGHYMQIVYQIAGFSAAALWASVVTFVILFFMNKVPGLNIRVCDEHEHIGLDLAEIGEKAYPDCSGLECTKTKERGSIPVENENQLN